MRHMRSVASCERCEYGGDCSNGYGDRSFAVASGAETSLDLIMVQLSNDLCHMEVVVN